MGKKYRELKKALKDIPQRDLVVVDDKVIRQKVFKEVIKIINKIDKKEEALIRFEKEDQSLYSSWYQLTFKNELLEIEVQIRKYRDLCDFHNQVVAESEKSKIDMPTAYKIICDENEKYESTADESVKKKIEEQRQSRIRHAQRQMENELHEDFGFHADDFNDEGEDLFSELKNADKEFEISDEQRDFVNDVMEMTDSEVRENFSDYESQHMLLAAGVVHYLTTKESNLLRKVWSLIPGKARRLIAQNLGFEMEIDIFSLVNELNNESISAEDEEQGFEESENRSYKAKQKETACKVNADEEFKLKSIYRQLARALHPDAYVGENKKPSWVERMWLQSTEAVKQNNLSHLERLWTLYLVRSKNLNSVSISEVDEMGQDLTEELKMVTRQEKKCKTHAAWGFAKSENRDKVYQASVKELNSRLAGVNSEINELKNYHHRLGQHFRQGPKRKTSKRNSMNSEQFEFSI